MPDQPIALYLPSLRGGGAEQVMVTLANGFAGFSVDRAVEGYLDVMLPVSRERQS